MNLKNTGLVKKGVLKLNSEVVGSYTIFFFEGRLRKPFLIPLYIDFRKSFLASFFDGKI